MQKRCFGKAFTVVGLQRQGMSIGDIIEVHSLKAGELIKGMQYFVAFGVVRQKQWFFGREKWILVLIRRDV